MLQPSLNQSNKMVQFCNMHIGEEIQRVLEENNINISAFAETVSAKRQNLYRQFKQNSINTDLLFRISKHAKYDFFKLFSDELKKETGMVEEPGTDKHEKKRRVMVEIELTEKEYQDLMKKR